MDANVQRGSEIIDKICRGEHSRGDGMNLTNFFFRAELVYHCAPREFSLFLKPFIDQLPGKKLNWIGVNYGL